jgi:cytochrome b/mono/diheme cytochrome c family protein
MPQDTNVPVLKRVGASVSSEPEVRVDEGEAIAASPLVIGSDVVNPVEEESPRIPVWDLAVRAFHWLLVIGVVAAWFTGGTGSRFHELAGFVVTSLLVFRLIWGFTGTTYARFSEFVRSPRTLISYLVDILRNRAGRHIGHNPAGAYMIVALLACIAVISVTGIMQMTSRFFGIQWVETLHHYAAIGLMSIIPLHLLGVLVSSWMHQENLIGAMLSGNKYQNLPGHEPIAKTKVPAAHEQIMMRLHANQGFSALLFLLACGLFVGWNSTSNRVETAVVVETPAAPAAAAATQVVALAIQQNAADQARDPQDYVISGPEDASDTWLISSGGRLYDNWYASIGRKGPAETHPAWPKANTTVSGDATWRCKSCHGWDYMGREGRYRSGSNATGIIGIQRMKGRDPGVIAPVLNDKTHAFPEELMPQHVKFRIAMFVSRGQHVASQYVQSNDKAKGDPAKGKPVFQSVCASCHGFDGRARKLGASSDRADAGYKGDALFVGTKAVSGPTEVLHKIRNGHPGAIMVSMRPFPMDVAANLLAYAQTLPTK